MARRAQTIYDSLTRSGQDEVEARHFRFLFTRLVNLGEGAEDTRRVVDREELGPNVWELAQRLAGASNRLIVTAAAAPNRETAEVAHEALIRGWPTLIDWINRDRAFLSWIDQLKPRVREWRADLTDEGTLLRGGPLAVAEDWLRRRSEEINTDEREYIQASISFRDEGRRREEAARQAEVERQRDLAAEAKRAADHEAELRLQAEKDRDAAESATREARAATETAQAARGRARLALVLSLILVLVLGFTAFLLQISRNKAANATELARHNLYLATKANTAALQQKNLASFSATSMAVISGAASDEALRLSEEARRAVDSGSLRDQVQTYLDFAKHFDLSWKPENGKQALQRLDEVTTSPTNADFPLPSQLLVYRHETAGDLEFTNASEPLKSPNEYARALSLLDRSDASQGDKARILAKLARVRLYNGDAAEAEKLLGQADAVLKLDSDGTFNKAIVDDVRVRVLLNKGDFSAARAPVDEAVSILTKVVATKPDDMEAVVYLAGELERLGDLQRYSKDSTALTSYRRALDLFEEVARQDPTSFVALGSIDTIRHSFRLLGEAERLDAEMAAKSNSTATRLDHSFAPGVGPFKFGMTPHEVNALLPQRFDESSFAHLPPGGEYRWAQVSYLWKYLNEVPGLALFDRDTACIMQHGYISFAFHESRLFRIVIRVFRNGVPTCPAIARLLDQFAASYGLFASGSIEERRIRYQNSRVAINAQTEPEVISLDFIQR